MRPEPTTAVEVEMVRVIKVIHAHLGSPEPGTVAS